ncbi:hypothetical protein B0T20DRAFT_503467 [Sordaria brevicollis]|uniref:Uncharacterized protein n=1 Tax=Sordaria brevicollis TaxID=83679 RepID=A0AAE0PNB0_SORBR|nr:hypothetical protein B0T20DRAFT_503467 [Sordaria brevicollis]
MAYPAIETCLLATMSSSTQHDDASGKQMPKTLADWVDKGPDRPTKRIRSLYSRDAWLCDDLSDDAILSNGLAADRFLRLMGTSQVNADDIDINKNGQLFFKATRVPSALSGDCYQAEIQRAAQLAGARTELLRGLDFVNIHALKLPQVRSCLKSVWKFASYAKTIVEKTNGLDDVNCDKLEGLRHAAQEEIAPRMSEIEDAIITFDRIFTPDPSDSDIQKSDDVLRGAVELFGLSASEIEELEVVMQEPRNTDRAIYFLREKLRQDVLQELQEYIELIEEDNATYRKCRSACFQPIEHFKPEAISYPGQFRIGKDTFDYPGMFDMGTLSNTAISQKSEVAVSQQQKGVIKPKPFPTMTAVLISIICVLLYILLFY